ncbi:MAG: FliM/FliN family flagellar motor switch protein [bacterium]|nr:FliM/FliN family flagellar motor switch protein [bacterium]
MKSNGAEEAVLSREELDALLEEIPKVVAERDADIDSHRPRYAEMDLQRANEDFAFEQGLALSNQYQRVIGFSLIGHREIDMSELAELMLPTDLVAAYQILPKGLEGYLLMSRPFFFQMLSMSFGSGPTLKPTRPPTREYSRIERRFYARSATEMLAHIERAWNKIAATQLSFEGLISRASVADSLGGFAVLATFDVKGFSEACRVRIAIPASAFGAKEAVAATASPGLGSSLGVSVMEVPIRLRAQVGTAELSLAEVGRLEPGSVIPLDVPSDGALTVRIGSQDKFRAIAGTQGGKRAVQLGDRVDSVE